MFHPAAAGRGPICRGLHAAPRRRLLPFVNWDYFSLLTSVGVPSCPEIEARIFLPSRFPTQPSQEEPLRLDDLVHHAETFGYDGS